MQFSLPALARHRAAAIAVIAVWAAAAALLTGAAVSLPTVEKNQNSAYLPASAQSTRVQEIAARFPATQTNAAIVLAVAQTPLSESQMAVIRQARTRVSKLPVLGASAPGPVTVSSTDTMAFFPVQLPRSLSENRISSYVTSIERALPGPHTGLAFYVTGNAGITAAEYSVFGGIDGPVLLAAVIVVAIVLLITYRSPVLWIFPLVTASTALLITEGLIYHLAQAGLIVSGETIGILDVLLLGAATDYALLLTSRYREELRKEKDHRVALETAMKRVIPTVALSGAAVICALLCLLLSPLKSISGLGPTAAIAIALALTAQVTLLPAVLSLCGRWLFWPTIPRHSLEHHRSHPLLLVHSARIISRHPRKIWIATCLLLAVCFLGLLTPGIGTLGIDNSFTTYQPAIAGAIALAKGFPQSTASPLLVAVMNPDLVPRIEKDIASISGVGSLELKQELGKTTLLTFATTTGAAGPAATAMVSKSRTLLSRIAGADALVGGPAAITVDQNAANAYDSRVVLPSIVLVVMLLLALMLRSVAAPPILAATVAASYVATFGISAFVFHYVMGLKGTDPSLLIYTFVFLIALGTDYNVFLMARVREESSRHGIVDGTIAGLVSTGGVITSAGVVLASTFAVLATLPLVQIIEIGLMVAIGVLLDTFVVRTILVPALVMDAGRWFWWPNAPARDIKGAAGHGRPEPERGATSASTRQVKGE